MTKPNNNSNIFIYGIKRLLPVFLFLLICALSHADEVRPFLADHPEPVFKRALTESEVALPFDHYRKDYIGERTVKLNFDAPHQKPSVQWIRELTFLDHEKLTVDSRGHIWVNCVNSSDNQGIFLDYNEYEKNRELEPKPVLSLVRFKPDNTVSRRRNIYGAFQDYYPVVVCDGAVVMFVRTFNFHESDPLAHNDSLEWDDTYTIDYDIEDPRHDLSLWCVDLDGNTVWRTTPVLAGTGHYSGLMAWRISGNRAMLAFDGRDSGKFNIYSLIDGELIETLAFPDWYGGDDEVRPLAPIEIPGKGWIGFQKSGIVLFDTDFKPVWEFDIDAEEILFRPVIMRNSLVFGARKYIASIDLETGKQIWKMDTPGNVTIHGANSDAGRILAVVSSGENESSTFIVVDHEGNEIFSKPYQEAELYWMDRLNHTLVFNDGSVLYNDKRSLNLVDKNGVLLWEFSLGDLGFSADTHTIENNLNFTNERQLVIRVGNDSDTSGYIVSLEF